jgi:hypothetical protein
MPPFLANPDFGELSRTKKKPKIIAILGFFLEKAFFLKIFIPVHFWTYVLIVL